MDSYNQGYTDSVPEMDRIKAENRKLKAEVAQLKQRVESLSKSVSDNAWESEYRERHRNHDGWMNG